MSEENNLVEIIIGVGLDNHSVSMYIKDEDKIKLPPLEMAKVLNMLTSKVLNSVQTDMVKVIEPQKIIVPKAG